jgi:2-dehydropantoate 2-reductase
VLGGMAIISATLDAEGRIVQFIPVHDLVYGERAGGFSDRTKSLSEVLGGAGFNARASDVVMQDMWEKCAGLATNAGITCLMRASPGDILSAPMGATRCSICSASAPSLLRGPALPCGSPSWIFV